MRLSALCALFATLAILFTSAPVAAQSRPLVVPRSRPMPPPALMVRAAKRSVPLKLTRLAIASRVVGHIAETTMTMTFHNHEGRVLEGDLYFPLPEGSTVSGYGLDIKGRMVDGVVVGKHKARQVFEKEVRKGVDPGLVEWAGGNNFKTRVFPIPALGSRTIKVSYVSEVRAASSGSYYYLPLAFKHAIDAVSLRIEVVKANERPFIVAGGPAKLRFKSARDSFVAETSAKDARLDRDLYVRLPRLESNPVRVERAPDGRHYFALRDVSAKPKGLTTGIVPRRLGIYWDASASRSKAAVAEELAVLKAWLATTQAAPIDVRLVVFRNVAERAKRFSLPADKDALVGYIAGLDYDGGTQLATAQPGPGGFARDKRADFNLLFTDGVSNFGEEDPRRLKAPAYVINASTTANHAMLRYLAMRTGGSYYNLGRVEATEVVASIGKPAFSFISATVEGGTLEGSYPSLRTPVHGTFDLVGRLHGPAARVVVAYGFGDRIIQRKTFVVKREQAVSGDLLRRYWAGKKVDELLIFPERNADRIATLGRRFGIVTPETSLLVLETLALYIEHEVRPPAMLASMRRDYDREMDRRERALKVAQASKLKHILALWEKRVAWWNKRFKHPRPGALKKKPKKLMARGAMLGAAAAPRSARRSRPLRARAMAADDAPAEEEAPAAPRSRPLAKGAKKEAKGDRGVARRPEPTIAMKAWDPKTPYIRAIRRAPKKRQYAVYLEQRAEHGGAPAFFLDCASHFRKTGRAKLALRILSNLAELELENPALLRVLGHRLAQIGELDLAATMFAKVADLRPEEPQSFRDLALVLDRRARRDSRDIRDGRRGRRSARVRSDYKRAMRLLAKVVMQRWDRFDEIEVIALTELNDVLPRAREAGVSEIPVDKRLIKHLDMDIRIVMSWDADQTDMDLHVLEPSGEHAYYGHNRTRIGGLVTRDFTRGYGPEVYAVRRAMKGKYTIRTKFFGSSAAKLAGAVTLQVDVYTNYGRPTQRRRSVTLRLTERKETFTVAEIRI